MRFILLAILFTSCSVSKKIERKAEQFLFSDRSISKGHIGISIYDPNEKKNLYHYQADKYFIPASNTKIFTLYAGLKYLGDSLTGIAYQETDSSIRIQGMADPSFLHYDFKEQPVLNFLKKSNKQIELVTFPELFFPYGPGWSWDDYNERFMPERSSFPIYGNVIRFENKESGLVQYPFSLILPADSVPAYFQDRFMVERELHSNAIRLSPAANVFTNSTIPLTGMSTIQPRLLEEVLGTPINIIATGNDPGFKKTIHSQPTDTVLQKMMFNSDNLFAEQILLMASYKKLGYFSDRNMIDSLLYADLKDIPQKPRWVDGSGLSRYNLFTPQSMVYIIEKMKNEFGIEKLKALFPTGGQGTLSDYYLSDSSFVFAKTGSLGNVTTLSGFLFTKKSKLLIFSVLVNNYRSSATWVRRAVEQFIGWVRETY